ncbi:MAG: thymidine phosphorylase [Caulobacter sp.]|nr:thymidine phosphorylase [Caulobacter sp.]
MLFQDVIHRKRDGGALSADEIAAFVSGLADGSLPGEQAAAMAMAIWFKGMSFEETGAFTRAMANSGVVIDWADQGLDGPVVDKHATGGIGDTVSLMLAPIVAACGAYVPMISGRGLGHTGGTLDKMASIPGYSVTPDLERFKAVVREVGCAIIGQTGQLAPADGRMYAIRSITATIDSTPLINGSILSKKLAAGLQGLVMDVKAGSGTFMRDRAEAEALARSLIGTGAHCGLKIHAVITDMAQPLGDTAGNALEVAEAVRYLRNEDREARLDDVVMQLAAEMLVVVGLEGNRAEARARCELALTSGRAAEVFGRMVHALGGPADVIERWKTHPDVAPVIRAIHPERAGFIAEVDGRAVGNAIIALGGGRVTVDDAIDPRVGFEGFLPIGSAVGDGVPLAVVHAASEADADRAEHDLKAAYRLSDEAVAASPVVMGIIE